MRRTFSELDFEEFRPARESTGSSRVPRAQHVETERWPEDPSERTLQDMPPVTPEQPVTLEQPIVQERPATWEAPAASYPPAPQQPPLPQPPPAQSPLTQPPLTRQQPPEPPRQAQPAAWPEPYFAPPRHRSGVPGWSALALALLVTGGFWSGGLHVAAQMDQLLGWGYTFFTTGSVPGQLVSEGKTLGLLCAAGVVSFVLGNFAVGTRRGRVAGSMAVTLSLLAPWAGLIVFVAAALGLVHS